MDEYTRSRIMRESEDEINILRNGISCAPKHVKRYCRNRILYLEWVISRVRKNRPFDVVPSTVYIAPRI